MMEDSDDNLVSFLRKNIQPQGSLRVVRLMNGTHGHVMYDYDFIMECVDDIQRISITYQLDKPSPLERLGMFVLLSHAEGLGYKLLDDKKGGDA